SMRALAYIKSELGRRQRIFNESGVNNINEYTKLYKSKKVTIPLPHLLLISDEFAELKHEQPEFMAELVSTSRIGRSLGVHLILATQKPSGIVDDQIWSNSKFKLALKVQDVADSKEVIKTPDAAQITNPGRAYLQVGNNEVYELFQSAFSGAYFDEETEGEGFDRRVYRINNLGQRELISEDKNTVENKANTTQLAAVVEYIKEVYNEGKYVPVEKTWLPSLPEVIVNKHIDKEVLKTVDDKLDIMAETGIVDIPQNQSQKEFVHDFLTDGNIVIFGSQGVGKSVFLTNIAMTLAFKNRTENLHYYILDFGNSSLIQLKDLPQTADYISFEDEEKLTKLVRMLEDEIKLRKRLFAKINAISFANYNEKAKEKLPAIIIFIDNYDVVKELGIDLEGFINKLSRDGAGIGIYMAVSATRQGAIRYSILNNFKNKIAGYLFDKTDILGIVGRSKYQLPEIKGRALIKLDEVNIMQCYTPVEFENYTENIEALIKELNMANLGKKPDGIRVMPEIVTVDMVLSDRIDRPGIGLDTDEIEVQYLELCGNIHMVVGKEGTGKTNVLKLILEQLKEAEVYICDSVGSELGREYKDMAKFYFNNEVDSGAFYKLLEDEVSLRVSEYERVKNDKSLREFCMELTQVVIVIDDIERFINLCKDIRTDLEKLIPKLLDYGISIVEAVTPNELRGFDELTKKLKDVNSGVVLGIPDEQSFIRMPVIRNYKFVIGTGFVFKGGDIKKVKIPLI
ncbi:MAG: FtsK/SpoIIIE domain-containing protein, partial [Lachnoanaerobaculum saburreum]